MKRKLNYFLIILGLCIVAVMLVFMFAEIIDFESLWVKYVLLFGLLLFFIGLSRVFKRATDLNNAIACLNGAKKNINKICEKSFKSKKDIVRAASVHNQLRNAHIYLSGVVDKFDLYSLREKVKAIGEITENYSVEQMSEISCVNYEHNNELIEATLKDIEKIKKDNKNLI